MAYKVEEIIDSFGIDKARELILVEGLDQVSLHQRLNISKSTKRMSAAVYKRIYTYLGIRNLPYPDDSHKVRKFKLQFDTTKGRYWESRYIVDCLFDKLQNPITNWAEGRERLVITFPKHPKANKDSNQIKAHVVAWELFNEQYVPEDCWVIPTDNDYTNISPDNLILVNTTTYKSRMFSGIMNPAYVHGLALRPKQAGWQKIAKDWVHNNPICKSCGYCSDLVVHHIINYHLFENPKDAHASHNLMTLCRGCHTGIHAHNTNIRALIEATQYSKLLELLETLKSQVPDVNIEIYLDVEKQLGLTDNQQPST
jgi:hypothetical protein